MRAKIEQAVREALAALGAGEASFAVERPRAMVHGDYATNAALVAKVDVHELAAKLKVDGIERVEVAGKFINFWLSREALAQVAQDAAEGKFDAGSAYQGKTVMVEYTDPNPFKEFHIGHLMTNAIGESIARLFERAGAKVARANYQGDVGLHVAKAIWGKMQKPEASWGEAYVYGSAQYDAHKKEIDALNKTIYDRSDAQVNKLYDEGRAQSLEHFEVLYKMLGTKFDYYFFESEVGPEGLKLVNEHPEIFEKSDGAVIFRGEKYGLHTRVFISSLGLPMYEAKELALVEAKKQKGNFDISLTVTASETREYFKVVRKAAELIFPDLEGKMLTRHHGMMRFASGKMSSRLGNVITGESLLRDLETAARERMGERELNDASTVAQQIAVGAIKYAILKQTTGKDIVFDIEKSLSLEGDSGPYVQYARVRAGSLMAGAQKAGIAAGTTDAPVETLELERVLVRFSDALERAAKELEPHYVATYLTELASAFNSWYASSRVIGGAYPQYGLLLAQAVERTLAEGLSVLGIPAPQEM